MFFKHALGLIINLKRFIDFRVNRFIDIVSHNGQTGNTRGQTVRPAKGI